MSVFGDYSRYYDLLYRDKDYRAETDFITSLLARHAPGAHEICELGCGTGHHAVLLAEMGHAVHGVDISETMLEAAHRRRIGQPAEIASRLRFSAGDVRTAQLQATFDAVLSLFHVVSYQTSNDNLLEMFRNAAVHLRPGGIFVFDYWYGPAVLTQRPATRVKRMESADISVTRLAESELLVNESLVDVRYHVFVRDKATDHVKELRETHRMRYLFATEIDFLARHAGFHHLQSCEWMSGAEPSSETWGVCSVLRK